MVQGATEDNAKKLPQYVAALAAAGGALAAGTLLGWTSPAENRLVEDREYGFDISKDQFSWISSAVNLGAAAICIPIGFLINIIGRKLTMLLLVLPFTVGWCLLIWAENVGMMLAARFLLGIAGGAFCVTAPMYTSEIAQKDIRGTLGSFFQLMITTGILFVYAIGAGLDVFWMSIVCAIIPLIFGVVFAFMPESPTYLIGKDKEQSAVKSLQWLRGKDYSCTTEIEQLKEDDANLKRNKVSVFSAMKRRATVKALFISLGLMFFQQLCGINAFIFYTGSIFKDAGTNIPPSLATTIVGIMQVIATLVSTMVVDKLGRRVLLMISAIVMVLSTVAIGIYFFYYDKDKTSVENIGWLPVASLCVFIVVFSLGFGPVPWLMVGELFASDIRGPAGSIAGTTNWLLAFLVTKTYVNIKDIIGTAATFWIFSGITFIGIFFVYFCVPETKGKSLIEIQRELEGNSATSNQQSNGSANTTDNGQK